MCQGSMILFLGPRSLFPDDVGDVVLNNPDFNRNQFTFSLLNLLSIDFPFNPQSLDQTGSQLKAIYFRFFLNLRSIDFPFFTSKVCVHNRVPSNLFHY